jgi:hypothetical protein
MISSRFHTLIVEIRSRRLRPPAGGPYIWNMGMSNIFGVVDMK